MLKILVKANRQKKKKKKEKVPELGRKKYNLFYLQIIFKIQKILKTQQKEQLNLNSEFSKAAGYTINIQKSEY